MSTDDRFGWIHPLGLPSKALYFDLYPDKYEDEPRIHVGVGEVPGWNADVVLPTGRGSVTFSFGLLFDSFADPPKNLPPNLWLSAQAAWDWLEFWIGNEGLQDTDNLFSLRLQNKSREVAIERVKRKILQEADGEIKRFEADFSGRRFRATDVDISGLKRPKKARRKHSDFFDADLRFIDKAATEDAIYRTNRLGHAAWAYEDESPMQAALNRRQPSTNAAQAVDSQFAREVAAAKAIASGKTRQWPFDRGRR